MKANEFYRLHQTKVVKKVVKNNEKLKSTYFDTNKLYGFDGTPVRNGIDVLREPFILELKRLVESHELVEKVGGLASAKANIREMVVDSGSGYVSDGAKLYDYDFSFGSLRKAIADVESCMEVTNENISNHN